MPKNGHINSEGFDFSRVVHIYADTDLDGVMPAAMLHARYPEKPITFTMGPSVPTVPGDLVLDLETSGDGWVIDHHPRRTPPKNPLRYERDGAPCTARLTYELLPRPGERDLLLSAFAEITEGLTHQEKGRRSIRELRGRAPHLFRRYNRRTQYHRRELIYGMADVVSVVCVKDPAEVLRVASTLDLAMTLDSLITEFRPQYQRLARRFLSFLDDFAPPHIPRMPKVNLEGEKFYVTPPSETYGDFSIFALSLIQMSHGFSHRTIAMLREGRMISIRSPREESRNILARKLGDLVESHGGRDGRHRLQLRHTITQDEFLSRITS